MMAGYTEATGGEYKITNIPPGSHFILATAKDHSLYSKRTGPVNVREGVDVRQDLTLLPGGSITGYVTGIKPEMTNVAPFKVTWGLESNDSMPFFAQGEAPVTDDGTYLLKNVALGKVRVRVNNGWTTGHYAEDAIVTIASGEQVV